MSKIIETRTKSVLPVYTVGLVFLVCGILLPLYRLWALILTAVLAVGGYLAAARLCPDRVVQKEVAYATGDATADELLEQIDDGLKRLHAVNEKLTEPRLSAQMDRMEKAGHSIATELAEHPEKAKNARRFAVYYLPDSVKILETYATMVAGGVKGENAASVQEEVRKNAETIATAFENQLDSLYSAEAMDISTDIEVLEGILKGQGLSK